MCELLFVIAYACKNHLAVGTYEEVAGDVVRGEQMIDLLVGVEACGEAVAVVGHKLLYGFAGFAARYGNHLKGLAGKAVDDFGLHVGKLFAAGRTPRSPEVYQHDIAIELREGDRRAVEHSDRKVGSLHTLLDEGRLFDFGSLVIFVNSIYLLCFRRIGALFAKIAAARGEQENNRKYSRNSH